MFDLAGAEDDLLQEQGVRKNEEAPRRGRLVGQEHLAGQLEHVAPFLDTIIGEVSPASLVEKLIPDQLDHFEIVELLRADQTKPKGEINAHAKGAQRLALFEQAVSNALIVDHEGRKQMSQPDQQLGRRQDGDRTVTGVLIFID